MGTLRALLAIAIVLNHGGGLNGYILMSGDLAVQCFYVISGFLITHILSTKYDDLWLFYSNRALRIFIPYWTVLAAMLTGCGLMAAFGRSPPLASWMTYGNEFDLAARAFLIFTNIFIVGQDLCLWLVRDAAGSLHLALKALESPWTVASFNILTPAWSLAVELMFYAVAPWLVRRNVVLLGSIVALSWMARSYAYSHGFYSSATAYRFFPFEIGLFLTGTLSYRLYRTLELYLSRRVVIGLTTMVLAAVLAHRYGAYAGAHPYQMIYAIALSLPALFAFSRLFKVDRWIGELSYPIYLIHWPVALFVSIERGPLWMLAVLAITILASIALVHVVAAPLDRWRNRRAARQSESRKAQTSCGQAAPGVERWVNIPAI